MDIVVFIGRILVGGYYLYRAADHLYFSNSGLTAYAASKNVPAPRLAVYGTGLLLLVGSLSILLGYQVPIGVAALVVFLVPTTVMMHNFWAVQDPMAKMGDTVNFTKNIGLLGSTLMFLAIPQPWPFSLGM